MEGLLLIIGGKNILKQSRKREKAKKRQKKFGIYQKNTYLCSSKE
jgi:hypothetical protein